MENKEQVEAGEIIHSIGNGIVDGIGNGTTNIGGLSMNDGRLLQELGHSLRVNRNLATELEFPALMEHGFNPLDHEIIVILGVAHRLIGNAGLVSFQ